MLQQSMRMQTVGHDSATEQQKKFSYYYLGSHPINSISVKSCFSSTKLNFLIYN